MAPPPRRDLAPTPRRGRGADAAEGSRVDAAERSRARPRRVPTKFQRPRRRRDHPAASTRPPPRYADLNEKHFEDGVKLNDRAMLADAAAAVGADRDAAAAFLADETAGRPEIEAAQGQLRALGVSGIPTLILGGKYQLPSGAHHSDSLVRAFRTIEAEGGAPDAAFAEALGISDAVLAETIRL